MKSAAKIVSASFINSDGWMRNWPKPTQRLEPWTWTPRPGHQHHEQEAEGDDQEERADALRSLW